MHRLIAVALVAVACGTAPAQAQALTLAYTKGTTYRYTVHQTSNISIEPSVSISPVTLDIKAKETATVNSVDSSGVADVNVTFTEAAVNMQMGSGASATTISPRLTRTPPSNFKIAPDGRVLSVNGLGLSTEFTLGFEGGDSLLSAVLPDNAVKTGDSWSKSYDEQSPHGAGAIHITANSKYLRSETFHGVQAAVVETTSTANVDVSLSPTTQTAGGPPLSATVKGTITSHMTSWIDPAAHNLLKTVMSSSEAITISDLTSLVGSGVPGAATGPTTIKGAYTLDLEPV